MCLSKCMQVAEKPSRKRAMPAGTDFFSPMRTFIQSDEQHYCNTIVGKHGYWTTFTVAIVV